MCQVNFDLTFKLGFGLSYKNLLCILLCLAISGASIFLGGLSALQNQCYNAGPTYHYNTNTLNGVNGFSSKVLECDNIYRFYWFIAAFEYVIVAVGLYAVCYGSKLAQLKGSMQGLFIVGTLLFIYTSEAFLNVLNVPLFQSDTLRDRSKTAVAGAIITATMNAIMVFLTGYQE